MFQKYTQPRQQTIYSLLCDILRDLNLHHPEESRYDVSTFERLNAFTHEDWFLLVRMAEAEGVAPLIYWAAKSLDDLHSIFNLETLNVLKQSYYTTVAQNTLFFKELDSILHSLEVAGIPVIVVKGAALAPFIYKDIGLRTMADLDLLVKPRDLIKSEQKLLPLGFDRYSVSNEIVMHNNNIQVDLHWTPVYGPFRSFYPTDAWFWDHIAYNKPIILDCLENVTTFEPTANFLHISSHFVMHASQIGTRLRNHYDLYAIIQTYQENLEIDYILQKFTCTSGISLFAKLMSDLYEFFAIPWLQNNQRDQIDIHNPYGKWSSITNRTAFVGDALRQLDVCTRLRLIISLFLPSKHFLRQRYTFLPAWLWPLLYLYRWIDLIKDSISSFLK